MRSWVVDNRTVVRVRGWFPAIDQKSEGRLGGRRFPVYYRMMRSLRSVRWIPLFVALLGTATAGFSQAVPTGWTIYPTPEEGSAELHCASFSRTVWRVSASEAGMLQI